MINNKEFGISNPLIAEFGDGDISVGGIYSKEDNACYLCLSNIDKKQIGDIVKDRMGIHPKDLENDIILKFNKSESIDVVVMQLLQIKSIMIQELGRGGIL